MWGLWLGIYPVVYGLAGSVEGLASSSAFKMPVQRHEVHIPQGFFIKLGKRRGIALHGLSHTLDDLQDIP
jgi:hypothetical protein